MNQPVNGIAQWYGVNQPREFEAAAFVDPFLGEAALPGVCLYFIAKAIRCRFYIDKSVKNIRSRVLSHLRTPDEAAMLRQARRISWICRWGNGALLLEARLIRTAAALFNKRLRRNRQLCSLQLSEQKVSRFARACQSFPHEPNLFGLFASTVGQRCKSLQNLADEQKLCYGLLGLEPR